MQKHVHDEFAKELPLLWLLLDTKTRWSSLFCMLARFYLILNAVRKANHRFETTVVAFTDDVLEHISLTTHCACSESSKIDRGNLVSTLHWGSCWRNWEPRRLILVLLWLMHSPEVLTNVWSLNHEQSQQSHTLITESISRWTRRRQQLALSANNCRNTQNS